MTETFKFRAFLSYQRSDRAVAQSLQRALELYVIPKALRIIRPGLRYARRPVAPIFRDETDLVPGHELPLRIANALRDSEYLIVLCTPSSAKSHWVEREILEFARLGRRDRILAVVAAGEPHASQRGLPLDQECLPTALRYLVDENGQLTNIDAEPLWVDWRQRTGSNRRLMFLRIVAALVGLSSLDELIQRDSQARKLRLAAFSGASVTFFAALLTIFILMWSGSLARSELLASLAQQQFNEGNEDTAALLAIAAAKNPVGGIGPQSARVQPLLQGYVNSGKHPATVIEGMDTSEGSRHFLIGGNLYEVRASGDWNAWNMQDGVKLSARGHLPVSSDGIYSESFVKISDSAVLYKSGTEEFLFNDSAIAPRLIHGKSREGSNSFIGTIGNIALVADDGDSVIVGIDVDDGEIKFKSALPARRIPWQLISVTGPGAVLSDGKKLYILNKITGRIGPGTALTGASGIIRCVNIAKGVALEYVNESSLDIENKAVNMWRVSLKDDAIKFGHIIDRWPMRRLSDTGLGDTFTNDPLCRALEGESDLDAVVVDLNHPATQISTPAMRHDFRFISWSPNGEHGLISAYSGSHLINMNEIEVNDAEQLSGPVAAFDWATDDSAAIIATDDGDARLYGLSSVLNEERRDFHLDDDISEALTTNEGKIVVLLTVGGAAYIYRTDRSGADQPLPNQWNIGVLSGGIADFSLSQDGTSLFGDGISDDQVVFIRSDSDNIVQYHVDGKYVSPNILGGRYLGFSENGNVGILTLQKGDSPWTIRSTSNLAAVCSPDSIVMVDHDAKTLTRVFDHGARRQVFQTKGNITSAACGRSEVVVVIEGHKLLAYDSQHIAGRPLSDRVLSDVPTVQDSGDRQIVVDQEGKRFAVLASTHLLLSGRLDRRVAVLPTIFKQGEVSELAISPRGDYIIVELRFGVQGAYTTGANLVHADTGLKVMSPDLEFALFSPSGDGVRFFNADGNGIDLPLFADDRALVKAACRALPVGNTAFSGKEAIDYALLLSGGDRAPCARRGFGRLR